MENNASKKAHKDALLKGLAQGGYELSLPSAALYGEELLLNLVRQNDLRFLEGFPVVLIKLMREKKELSWEKNFSHFRGLLSAKDRVRLFYLLAVSYFLFKLYGEDHDLVKRLEKLMETLRPEWRSLLAPVEKSFGRSESVSVDRQLKLSLGRFKTQYRNYVKYAPEKQPTDQEELVFELNLSRNFTPRQKELVRKRQKGETMTDRKS